MNERNICHQIETNSIAETISNAPTPVKTVKDSPRKIMEIITETRISFNRITDEVTGDIFLNPLDQI